MKPRSTANESFIVQTARVWEPRRQAPVTADDAREMVENVAGFFSLLARWKAEEGATEALASVNGKE